MTKIKEQLENFLSESNKIIKTSEKINKGIKAMEKEDKNMIKILSYITKINKNKKKMNSLFQTKMKNLKISFEEDKNNIKYEEYIFNALPIPKNIEFKDITMNSFKIIWTIEEFNILNNDKNRIKFKVEMRKENENFQKTYEINDNKCLIDNLNLNTI